MKLYDFVTESNRIEGISREPLPREIHAHETFLALSHITITDVEKFVSMCEPGAVLRDIPGLDVCVGAYVPPLGGPQIKKELTLLLEEFEAHDAFDVHQRYEQLHPFTDGNGRSGRVIWLWQIGGNTKIGFLHQWYYQSLNKYRYVETNVPLLSEIERLESL